jgi:hypothetical protein
MKKLYGYVIPVLLCCLAPLAANAQSFRTQCPTSTITHPVASNTEPAYTGPTVFTTAPLTNNGTQGGYQIPSSNINGAIKCQQISGGDGLSTMADGTQIFMFSFGPLSGLADIAAGHAGTEFPNVFNASYPPAGDSPSPCPQCNSTLAPGDPALTDGASAGNAPGQVYTSTGAYNPLFTWNGAVGLAPNISQLVTVTSLVEGDAIPTGSTVGTNCAAHPAATIATAWTDAPIGIAVGQQVVINSAVGSAGVTTPGGYVGTWPVTCVATQGVVTTPDGFTAYAFQFQVSTAGVAADTGNDVAATAATPSAFDGHVDPRQIMDIGVMNGNIPAPLMAFDEDDEFFLTLTNVGMIMRPDLFEQHTVHFHGYPNASSFYDGVPDASVAINIGGSFTYYYLAPDAGTYFWHCHITPPEHLQMGMVGQLYVRPRQDRVPETAHLYAGLQQQNSGVDLRTACNPAADILCSAVTPPADNGAVRAVTGSLCNNPGTANASGLKPDYIFNDGDGSSCYDTTYPIQMHGFDPNFHFVGMTFNPEMFADMKDKYFLLNGRSYPDTVGMCGGVLVNCVPGPQATVTTDGTMHYSQPLPAIINIPAGGKASLRLVNLSVAEYFTLQSVGIPMKVVGWNAKLLRDQGGNNTEYYTNSITLGGGESNDVILDASDAGCGSTGCANTLYPAGSVFYVYTPNLDMLSNDAENFGGMMTEVHICGTVSGGNTFGNTCSN